MSATAMRVSPTAANRLGSMPFWRRMLADALPARASYSGIGVMDGKRAPSPRPAAGWRSAFQKVPASSVQRRRPLGE